MQKLLSMSNNTYHKCSPLWWKQIKKLPASGEFSYSCSLLQPSFAFMSSPVYSQRKVPLLKGAAANTPLPFPGTFFNYDDMYMWIIMAVQQLILFTHLKIFINRINNLLFNIIGVAFLLVSINYYHYTYNIIQTKIKVNYLCSCTAPESPSAIFLLSVQYSSYEICSYVNMGCLSYLCVMYSAL